MHEQHEPLPRHKLRAAAVVAVMSLPAPSPAPPYPLASSSPPLHQGEITTRDLPFQTTRWPGWPAANANPCGWHAMLAAG